MFALWGSFWLPVSLSVAIFLPSTRASYPGAPVNVTILSSGFSLGATVSFKEARVCGQLAITAYSGYVYSETHGEHNSTLPSNVFFLYLPATSDPDGAPLTIWLGGGPGESSTMAAFGENGPCNVLNDSMSTFENIYSWTAHSNMLYIDQPLSTGFSYRSLLNGTIDQLQSSSAVIVGEPSQPENATLLHGTFASQDDVASSSFSIGSTIWDFLQIWQPTFPFHDSSNKQLNLWSQSYGGRYLIDAANYILGQNALLAYAFGSDHNATQLELYSVGIINGYIDVGIQSRAWSSYAQSNPYGVPLNDDLPSDLAMVQEACTAKVSECRDTVHDDHVASIEDTQTCIEAEYCIANLLAQYTPTGRNPYDITRSVTTSQWPRWAAGYLNDAAIQQELGVPLNFTQTSEAVYSSSAASGDLAKGDTNDIAPILAAGVKVALVYGDRDFLCNWLGGEDIANNIPWPSQHEFNVAGYEDFYTHESYIGGKTKQYGNLSFTRIFDAGHEVPYDQPEAALSVFSRTIQGFNVADGKSRITNGYSSIGMNSSEVRGIMRAAPDMTASSCYLWSVPETCDEQDYDLLMNGGLVVDYILQHSSVTSSTSTVTELPTSPTTDVTTTRAPSSSSKAWASGSAFLLVIQLLIMHVGAAALV